MTDNDSDDEKRLHEKRKFNEERIRVWKQQRQASAEIAAKSRKEKADQERALRVEHSKRQRQEEIHQLEQEKKAAALEKLPNVENIAKARQAIVFEHHRRKTLFFKKGGLLLLVSGLLTTLIILLTTPFYEAQAIVTIKTNNSSSNGIGTSLLPSSVNPSIMQNIFSAREYIYSREMMNHMEKEHGFIGYFKKKDIHFFSRPFSNKMLGSDDYDYYKRRVKTAIDIQEGILRIKVQAKNQHDAKYFADALLLHAEKWVNSLSDKMFDDKIKEANTTLAVKEKNLQLARKRIVNFQISYRDLNPRETVAAIYSNLNDIKAKIKQSEREIAVYHKANVTSSPVVERLRNNLSVLKQQQKSLNKRLVDNGDQSLNKILSGFESALIERDLAEKEWAIALKSLEEIKSEVFNQRQYFLTIVPPITSPLPVEPQWLKLFLLSLISLYVMTAIASLIKTNIKISLKT